MTAGELRSALAALGWSSERLGVRLGCNGSLVRQWTAGRISVPGPVGVWLRRAVRGLRSAGPPPVGWRVNPGYSVASDEAGAPTEAPGSLAEAADGEAPPIGSEMR